MPTKSETADRLTAIRERRELALKLRGAFVREERMTVIVDEDVEYLLGLVERLDRKCELQERLIACLDLYVDDEPQIEAARAELTALETEQAKP